MTMREFGRLRELCEFWQLETLGDLAGFVKFHKKQGGGVLQIMEKLTADALKVLNG